MKLARLSAIIVLAILTCHVRLAGEATGPIRKLTYDPKAIAVDLLSPEAQGKVRVRVIPQNEFESRIVIENLTDEPLTVRLPKAVAAVHQVSKPEADRDRQVRMGDPQEPKDGEATGNGQAVVGTFGPMNDSANGFPHQSPEGNAFTIPANKQVMILLHSACAEHGKRPPLSRMTYELRPLDKQVENETLQRIIQSYDPQKTDPLAFQAVVWHLANGLSWDDLANKTLKAAGQLEPYSTRSQLVEALRLLEHANAD